MLQCYIPKNTSTHFTIEVIKFNYSCHCLSLCLERIVLLSDLPNPKNIRLPYLKYQQMTMNIAQTDGKKVDVITRDRVMTENSPLETICLA